MGLSSTLINVCTFHCVHFFRKNKVTRARKITLEKYAFLVKNNVFNFLSTELNNTHTGKKSHLILYVKPLTITPQHFIEIKHHLIKIRSAKVKRCIRKPYGKLSSDPLIIFVSVYINQSELYFEHY